MADPDTLRVLWAEALGLDPRGPWSEDETFFELGGYSLLALSLAQRLSEALGRELPRALVLERRTLAAVREQLAGEAAVPRSREMSEEVRGGPADPFPMSPLQQAYLLGETGDFELAGPALFVEDYCVADLDVDRLESALSTLVRRHEMLRAVFHADGTQRVGDEASAAGSFERRDLSALSADEAEAALSRSFTELSEHAPDPGHGPVIRLRVFRLSDCHRVHVQGRLLVFDGRSGEVFADELRAIMTDEALTDLEYTYSAYRRRLAGERDEAAATSRTYWQELLPTLPDAPDLPYRHDNSADGRLTRRTFTLDASQWSAFTAAAARNGVSPTAALCTAFGEVLRHFSGTPDFTINMLTGERRGLHPHVPGIIGNFSDTMLLACPAEPGSFAARAARVSGRLTEALAHSGYSGVEVIRDLAGIRGAGRAPAMPVVFASTLGGPPQDGIFLERLGWQRVRGTVHTPQVSFDHQVFDSNGALVGNWDTADGRFAPGIVDVMFEAYTGLLATLSTDPGAWQRTNFNLTPATQTAARAELNATDPVSDPEPLHEAFYRRARHNPESPAIIASDSRLTYGELATAALGVAAALHRAGVRPGDNVLVYEDRGWRQTAAILAVVTTGAAYVPLGARWPQERVSRVIERSGARHVVSGARTLPGWADGLRVVTIGGESPARYEPPRVDPESPAYVLFTSGSTGEPKGVVIRHAAAHNTIADLLGRFEIDAADRVLALAESTFDLSVFDLFGTLAAGGSIIVPRPEHTSDAAALHALCAEHGVTVWNSVPAQLGMLVAYREAAPRDAMDSLRLAMVSGDWVPVDLGGRLAATLPKARLVSLGGATEASIWSTWYPVPEPVPPEWGSVPYGTPLAGQGLHVLDAALADRPDWVPGDLYISGRGLADGYLGEPALTAAAFPTRDADGLRLYRTGDRARYRPDGTVEFLGRLDDQVKINGLRVETGDVEAALLADPAVLQAAVVPRRDAHGAQLVAHVVLAPGTPPGTDLLSALRSRLPEYLVPGRIVEYERLPETALGKIDRARLAREADPPPEETGGVAVGPRDAVEKAMLELWRGFVPVEGVTDDFFARGGHSLTAAALLNAVEREFGARPPMSALYQSRTVRGFVGELDRSRDRGPEFVPLGGSGPELVLVHPVGGDVLCYRVLAAALGADFSVYGIALPLPDRGRNDNRRTVPGLARRYIDLVVRELPGRRIAFVGWSFGSLVAYEMAALAADPGPVVLVDPWIPAAGYAPPTDADLRRDFLHDLAHGGSDRTETIERVDANLMQRIFARYVDNTRALLRYRPRTHAGVRATVVTATEGFGARPPAYLAPFDLPGAERYSVETDHYGVVDRRADDVAALIRTAVLG